MILALEIMRAWMKQGDTVCRNDMVTSNYLGGTMTGITSSLHGEASVLWGALGKLEGIVPSGDDEARWALLERLGSVVAEATGAEGADISELVSYAEFGEPSFESVGYQNPYGFTGQLQDGGTGRVSFGSRDYDPATAAWFAPDEWPGLIEAPQSLNRYAYVLGNPVTYADTGGFRPYEPGYSVTKNGQGWQYQKQAPKTVLNPSAWANHYGRQVASGWNAGNTRSYAVVGPSGKTQFMSARHATATRQVTATPSGFRAVMRQISGITGTASLVLGGVSAAAAVAVLALAGATGLSALIPVADVATVPVGGALVGALANISMWTGVGAVVLGAVSTVSGCVGYDWDSLCKAQLITGYVGLALPGFAGTAFGLLTGLPYVIPGVSERRDVQWYLNHG